MSYCMNDEDAEFLSKLNDGKDVNDEPRKDKLGQCSEDVFEEAMNYLEETTARLQPFAAVESVSLPGLEEMERAIDDNLSADAQTWLKPVYQYWWSKKGSRSLMPSIKVRVLDTSNDADDADPYVCFRRREVRQTRKTRGRDAQVVEKLKKLRLELEQARQLVQLVVQREQLNKEDLEISRRVFEERKKLKDVKIDKNIIGEKGEDEELLVNQKVCLPEALSHRRFSNCSRSQLQKPRGPRRPDVLRRSAFVRPAIALRRRTSLRSSPISRRRRMQRSSEPSLPARNSTGDGMRSGRMRPGGHSLHPLTTMTTSQDGRPLRCQTHHIPRHLRLCLRRIRQIERT